MSNSKWAHCPICGSEIGCPVWLKDEKLIAYCPSCKRGYREDEIKWDAREGQIESNPKYMAMLNQ